MSDAPSHLTIVLRLPEDQTSREEVVKDFQLFGKFKEADVTAMYAGDAISEAEQLEELVSPAAVERIRRNVAKTGRVAAY